MSKLKSWRYIVSTIIFGVGMLCLMGIGSEPTATMTDQELVFSRVLLLALSIGCFIGADRINVK